MASVKQKSMKLRTIHQKRKVFRSSEPLLSVFQWGINHTISQLQYSKRPALLMPDDFRAHSKVKVDNHLFNKEIMPNHFKFKEYCPLVFRDLRARFDMDDADYVKSLCKHQLRKWGLSSGRSGSQFLHSADHVICVKTISSEEVAQMHTILQAYHQYVVENKGETLLPHYFGMYRVTVSDNETYLLVMKSVFSPRLAVHRKYDLKGSTVDRQASDKEKAKALPTLKDNDFLADSTALDVGADQKETFMKLLKRDVQWLSHLNLMDYSLLVGIHDIQRGLNEAQQAFFAMEQPLSGDELDDDDDDVEGGTDPDDTETSPAPADATVPEKRDRASTEASHDEEGRLRPAGLAPAQTSVDSQQYGGSPPLDSPPMAAPRVADPRAFGYEPFDGQHIDPRLERFGIMSRNGDMIYFLAIIDVLTRYGVKKMTANAAKTVKYGAGAEISTVRPDQYAARFTEFVEKAIQ